MIFEIISGGEKTDWVGKEWAGLFFPRGKNGPAHSFPGEKTDWGEIPACYTGLSPPVKYFTDRSKAVLLLWIFYVFVLSCVCYVLCASVYMCFVVTCWERADLLALVCGVFCQFVTFPLVSWVRCGT